MTKDTVDLMNDLHMSHEGKDIRGRHRETKESLGIHKGGRYKIMIDLICKHLTISHCFDMGHI